MAARLNEISVLKKAGGFDFQLLKTVVNKKTMCSALQAMARRHP
jgi:hypothetical protein